MKTTIERLWRKLSQWLAQQRLLRRRKLHVVRLEDRRLPDASFGATLGALTLGGFDGGDSLNVEFDSSANQFQFSLTDGHWDSTHSGNPGFHLSPDGKLLTFSATSLQALTIDSTSSASGGLTPLSVTDSTGGIAVGQLTILGAGSVVLDSTANDFDHLAISAESLDLFDSNDVSIQSLDIHHDFTLTAVETITNTAGATISVGGHAQIVGSTIVLGDAVSDSIHFGSLSFHATGAVSIIEADDTVLSGSSTADSLTLNSAGILTDDGTANLHVNDMAHFDADAIVLDDTYHFGSLTASSRFGGISISESDNMSVAEITSAADIHLSSSGAIHVGDDAHLFADHHAEIILTAATKITIGHGASIHAEGGNIVIDAGPHGDLFASGRIDVSDLTSGDIGGTVHLLGERVALFDGAIVDASGDAGGGTVLIGGDYQGANAAIHNAAQSFVGSDAAISANAISTGNGGRIIIWSDNNTEFFGMLSARSTKDGHGGFAEVSGKDLLTFFGSVDLTGKLGGGILLLDPKNITIADTATPAVRTSNDAFNENPTSSVTFDADTITAVTNTGVDVVLQASNDITISESIITNRPDGIGGGLTLQAGRSVIINANIITDDAALSITANETLANGVVNANRDPGAATITMASGTTILAGAGNVALVISTGAGLTNHNSGDLTLASLTSSGAIFLTNNGTTTGSNIVSASATSMISAGTLTLLTTAGTIGDSFQALKLDATTLNADSSAANSAQYLSEVNTVAIGTTGLNAGTGTVTLTSGTFTLAGSNRINDSTTLAIASGTIFQMKGFSETIGGLTDAGTVENESGAANTSTLTVETNSVNTFSGVLQNGDGTGTDGTLALTKSGSETLTLSGSNTYTGATIISGGTLQVDGTIDTAFTSTATVTVSGGARLNGTGTINNAVAVSTNGTLGGSLNITGPVTINSTGTLSPGNSPGIISTGDLNLASGSTFIVEIEDNNTSDPLVTPPGAVAGTDYDQIQVTGSVTIGATAELNLQDLGSTGINPRDVYVIIDNDGSVDPVSGTFGSVIGATDINGGTLASGDLLDLNGNLFRIFYNGGDGNDVVLIGRPAVLPNVFVSTSFVGLNPGALIPDVDFITGGAQPGVYGIDGFATVAEGIAGVDTNGVIHVGQGIFLHTGTLQVDRSVTINGQGMDLTQILKSGAANGNFDEAIRISADNVTLSDVKLGWQVHSTTVSNPAVDYKGYVVVTTADNTTISRVLFGDSGTGEGYRSAVVFEGTAGNGADGLEVSDSIFEGRWGRGVIRDGDAGSGENFLITRNEFREDHFRWGPIAIGPEDSAGTPNNFAFSGEISFNYFGNGLDAVDFQELGNQNYTVTISNQGLTAQGLQILHNTFDWNDSNVVNQTGNYAQPAGVYITPALTGNASQILIQDNIFNNFAYAGPQPGTTDPPVSGYGVVTPAVAVVLNNVFFNDVTGEYADSNQTLDPGNITGATANPFFKGDDPNVPYTGTSLAEFYRLRWGSSATFQSTEFQADIATMIPHVGVNQEDPVAFGGEDILVVGTDYDDLVVLTFTGADEGFFTFTRNVTGAAPELVGSFNFVGITSFTFHGYGGDDVFIIIQPTATQGSLYSLINGITFNGGTQNSDGNALNSDGVTGGDTLILLTSATDQAVLDSADYVFGNDDPIERHSGTITLTDGLRSTVIAFNGTEPIRDELSANARTFAFASTIGGGAEAITVSTLGDTVAMTLTTFMGDETKPQVTSRTLDNRIQSTLGPSVSFANSNTQITISAGIGNDVVNIDSIHANLRSALTINGNDGNDTVNLNANLTLGNTIVGNTGNLTVTAETINLAAAVAIDTTAEITGDGNVLLIADSNVILNAGSTITTSTGYVLGTTSDGPIDVNGIITTGSGNVLLMANGSGRNIELDANIISSIGHITLMAKNSVNVGLLTNIQTGGAGTIIIEAAAGSVTMNMSSTLSTVDGDIRVNSNGDVTVSRVSAGNANISLISIVGSILDADTDDSDTDIIALGLRIQAAVGIGTLGVGHNAIETTISTLSIRTGGGGINVLESDGLTVDDVTVTTKHVQTDGTTLAVTDATQSDLVTTSNGSIVLRTLAGNLVLNDGTAEDDGSAIDVNGAGNLLLQTLANNGDVIVHATVMSGTGHITLHADRDVDVNAALSTGGGGTVSIVSGRNTDIDAVITTENGDILVEATSSLWQTALITSTAGDIGLIAGQNITQTATGDLTTGSGDVLVTATAGNWTMSGDATVRSSNTEITLGGGDFLGIAGNNITLGVITLTNGTGNRVALQAVAGSITDANAGFVNIEETVTASVTSVSLRAGTIIGGAGGTSSSTNTQAIDLNVDTVAAVSATGIYLREIAAGGGITVDTASAVTVAIDGVRRSDFDSSTTSVVQSRSLTSLEDLTTSTNGPIKLVAEAGTITIHGGVDGDGISANGSGDILLAARGVSSDVLVYANVISGGGDISITAEQNLLVRKNIISGDGVEDRTAETGESILLKSMSGNVTIDASRGPIRVSTDEDPGRSNVVTGDRVSIVADANNSIQTDSVKFFGDVTLSTDGGVATNFTPRPAIGQPSTAFFIYSSNPLPLTVDAVPVTYNGNNAYIYGFDVLIGVAGEENLTVNIDWQDPSNESGVISDALLQASASATGIDNAVSSERIQQFLVPSGGQVNTVGHVYTALDFTAFQSVQNRTTIIVDFSVAHHYSVNVTGSVIEQFGVTQSVPGRDITSTDNVLTGDNQFEGGIASFRIPTMTTAPLAFFYTEPGFAADRPTITGAFENNAGNSRQVVADFGSGAAGGGAFSTDVYFQIRRQYESDGPVEIVVERIADSQLISSREAFEEYVRQNQELQDGAGYEIWLISETGGQKVERPIVEFEITGGQPGPASETLPESSEPPQLLDLPFEQPVDDNNAAIDDSPQALILPKSDAVIGSTSPTDISKSDVFHATAEDSIVETAEIENSWSLNDVAVAVSQLGAPTGTIMSMAVSRFRGRVRDSNADDRKLTRAARFVRWHS